MNINKEKLINDLEDFSINFDKKVHWMASVRRFIIFSDYDYILFFPYLFKNEKFFKGQIELDISNIKNVNTNKEMKQVIELTYDYLSGMDIDLNEKFSTKKHLQVITYNKLAKKKRKMEKEYFRQSIDFYGKLLEGFHFTNEITAENNLNPSKSVVLNKLNFRNLFIHRKNECTDTKFKHSFPDTVLFQLNIEFEELGIESKHSLKEILGRNLGSMQIIRGVEEKKPAFLITFFFLFISEMFVSEGIQQEFTSIISSNELIISQKGDPIEKDIFYRELRVPLKGERLKKIEELYTRIYHILSPACNLTSEIKFRDTLYIIEEGKFLNKV